MQAINRLFSAFQPSRYDLDITLLRVERRFTGVVTIYGTTTKSSSLTIHSKELVISAVTVAGQAATFVAGKDDELIISSPAIVVGDCQLELTFSGTIQDPMHGLYPCYFEHNGRKKELLATQFESHHAREVFPCVDEPEAKAVFNLSLTTEEGVSVLSNTPVKQQTNSEDTQTTLFETTPKMSTYLLAFVVGELQYKEAKTKHGVIVRSWATVAQPAASLDFSVHFAAKVIEFFNDYFGIDYPLAKCDNVALPDFAAGAMENWGLITYRESTLLVDPMNSGVSQKQYVATVIAHEVSHQWFGNLVTMQWWNDLWLNESFAAMMEYVAIDAIYPEWDSWLDFASHDTVVALRRDCLPGVQAVSVEVNHPDEISTLFDPAIVYAKGANILKMLRAYVGDKAFRAGLRQYFTRHAYGNTTSDDLWVALAAASGKDIKTFMSAWIYKPGYPKVAISQNETALDISQKRLLMATEDNNSIWPIPLFANQAIDEPVLQIRHAKQSASSDVPVLLNQGGQGFFVTQYLDERHKEYIATQLAEGKFSPLDRLRILHETLLLARGGEQPITDAVRLLPAYAHESKDAVWDMMSLIISDARLFSEHDDAMEAGLKRIVLQLVGEQFAKLGTVPQKTDTEEERKLRASIFSLAVWAGNEEAVATALSEFDRFAKPSDLAVDLRDVIYATGARWRGEPAYEKLLHLYKTSTSAEERQTLAASMSACREPEIIDKILALVTDKTVVRLQDVGFWLIYMIRKKHSREATWNWMTSHWDWIEANFKSDKSYDDYPRYASGALMGKEWIKRYKAFFEPKLSDVALHRAITLGIADVEARTAWFERDEASLREYLSQM